MLKPGYRTYVLYPGSLFPSGSGPAQACRRLIPPQTRKPATPDGQSESRPKDGPPNRSPAKRVRFRSEEQQNECAMGWWRRVDSLFAEKPGGYGVPPPHRQEPPSHPPQMRKTATPDGQNKGRPKDGPPNRSPAKRVRFEKEEQGSGRMTSFLP